MHGNPASGNLLSQLIFPIFAFVSLAYMRRKRPTVSVPVVFLSGVMLLAERVSFRIPGLPLFDKHAITSLVVLLGLSLYHKRAFDKSRRPRLIRSATILLFVSGLGTALANGDPISMGQFQIHGMGPWDGMHFVVRDFLTLILPFAFGATLIRNTAAARDFLGVVAVCALVYTIPALIELRLSPQMHNWIYGFRQHSFTQVVRDGGYRPMILMEHGLAVGLFFAGGLTAAVGLVRAKAGVFHRTGRGLPTWLLLILILCKSKAALIYGALTWTLTMFTRPRVRMTACTVLAVIVLSYPFARAAPWFPTDDILDVVEDTLGSERAGSLRFRLTNEAALLEHAMNRPLFGWGTYERDELHDPWSGQRISVRDGYWIIRVGQRGLVGFALSFGLLLLPVFRASRLVRRRSGIDAAVLSTLGLLATIYAVDLVPNGLFSSLAFFYSGALYGMTRPLEGNGPLRRDASARTRPPDQSDPAAT